MLPEKKGMKMKSIAILGGAFDPVTVGHISAANYVLDNLPEIEEVWLTPCRGHTFGKKMTDPEKRLQMCYIAANDRPKIKVFDYEIKYSLPGDTFTFVSTLLRDEEYADCKFSLVIGEDNANCFQSWINYEELRKLIRFIVIPRNGVATTSDKWFMNSPHVYLRSENGTCPTSVPVSSSQVRKLFEIYVPESFQVMDLLDRNVFQFILSNNLYGPHRRE